MGIFHWIWSCKRRLQHKISLRIAYIFIWGDSTSKHSCATSSTQYKGISAWRRHTLSLEQVQYQNEYNTNKWRMFRKWRQWMREREERDHNRELIYMWTWDVFTEQGYGTSAIAYVWRWSLWVTKSFIIITILCKVCGWKHEKDVANQSMKMRDFTHGHILSLVCKPRRGYGGRA